MFLKCVKKKSLCPIDGHRSSHGNSRQDILLVSAVCGCRSEPRPEKVWIQRYFTSRISKSTLLMRSSLVMVQCPWPQYPTCNTFSIDHQGSLNHLSHRLIAVRSPISTGNVSQHYNSTTDHSQCASGGQGSRNTGCLAPAREL